MKLSEDCSIPTDSPHLAPKPFFVTVSHAYREKTNRKRRTEFDLGVSFSFFTACEVERIQCVPCSFCPTVSQELFYTNMK